MESRHVTKINKCLALKAIIESKGWCVELFAVWLVLGENALSLFYCVLKSWVSIICLSETLLIN